ncbi:MAG: hypothetical protein ACJAVM_000966 [Sulfitobacter sp.]|jgi:hypothetical protein
MLLAADRPFLRMAKEVAPRAFHDLAQRHLFDHWPSGLLSVGSSDKEA